LKMSNKYLCPECNNNTLEWSTDYCDPNNSSFYYCVFCHYDSRKQKKAEESKEANT